MPDDSNPDPNALPPSSAALRALVHKSLQQASAQSQAAADEVPEKAAAQKVLDDTQVEAALDAFFESDDPHERDRIFDQLVNVHHPEVAAFFQSMMQHEDDDVLRWRATEELARRGDATAIGVLDEQFDDPESIEAFALSAQVLSDLRGEDFYERLQEVWLHPERPCDQCCVAMRAMELLSPERAIADFLALVQAIESASQTPGEQLEAALLAFVRHDTSAAVAPLQALQARLQADDDEQAQELAQLVREALALLAA